MLGRDVSLTEDIDAGRDVSFCSQDGLDPTNIVLRPFLFGFVISNKQREADSFF